MKTEESSAGGGNSLPPALRYSVITADLPSGEELPLLVEAGTWLPCPLALKWVVFSRRWGAAPSTLRADLAGLRCLHVWCAMTKGRDLECHLQASGRLSYADFVSFAAFARSPNSKGKQPNPQAVARIANAVRIFLIWALQPANRGEPGAAPSDLREAITQINEILGPLCDVGDSERHQPISPQDEARIEELIAPRSDSNGRILRPLQFNPLNPFRRQTRLRFWLMWRIARDCGLRLGELLKLYWKDVAEDVAIHRRRNDPQDLRRKKPSVKTAERIVPGTPRVRLAMRLYLGERPPLGRYYGSSYLFSNRSGEPLSISGAEKQMETLAEAVKLPWLVWHCLRHTWAEEIATLLSEKEPNQELIGDHLRTMGGWSMKSKMPLHYAQIAWRKRAHKFMNDRQDRLSGARRDR